MIPIKDVAPGRYRLRGDVVDVVQLKPGLSARSTQVIYILREKVRLRGALEVGEEGMLGIVSFAGWATRA